MSNEALTFIGFAASLMEQSHRRMKQVIDSLTDEQLYWQPEERANSVGWLVWHLSRWKDIQTARIVGEPQVWSEAGWAACFEMPEDVSGYGDSPEQVAAFRADRILLLGYAEEAHGAALRRMSSATHNQLCGIVPLLTVSPATATGASILLTNAIDYTEHTGQIAYLHGLMTGRK